MFVLPITAYDLGPNYLPRKILPPMCKNSACALDTFFYQIKRHHYFV